MIEKVTLIIAERLLLVPELKEALGGGEKLLERTHWLRISKIRRGKKRCTRHTGNGQVKEGMALVRRSGKLAEELQDFMQEVRSRL